MWLSIISWLALLILQYFERTYVHRSISNVENYLWRFWLNILLFYLSGSKRMVKNIAKLKNRVYWYAVSFVAQRRLIFPKACIWPRMLPPIAICDSPTARWTSCHLLDDRLLAIAFYFRWQRHGHGTVFPVQWGPLP